MRDRNSVSALLSRKIGGILFNLGRAGSTDRMSCGTVGTEEMERIILRGPSCRIPKHIGPSGAALSKSHPCIRDSGIYVGASFHIPDVLGVIRMSYSYRVQLSSRTYGTFSFLLRPFHGRLSIQSCAPSNTFVPCNDGREGTTNVNKQSNQGTTVTPKPPYSPFDSS